MDEQRAEVWDFVVAAMEMCALVDDRPFMEEDFKGTACVLWRPDYSDEPALTMGGRMVRIRDELHAHFLGGPGAVRVMCDNTRCLNPGHLKRMGETWRLVPLNEHLANRNILDFCLDPTKCMLPDELLFYELLR